MREDGLIYELLRELNLSELTARTAQFLLVRPLRVLFVVIAAMVVSRLAVRSIRRAVRSFASRAPLAARSARAEQRASTLGDVLASLVRAVVWGVAVLVILDEFGINLAPLLAGAGIAGVAIGFGAQSLVKDVLSGMFILLEDQYGVGDVITITERVTGTVEDLTVRVTRLRGADGTVWFVPNGEIRQVGNSSMEWSRAVVDVLVSYDADLDLVRRAMKEEADAFAAEEEWAPQVLEEPEMLGVQATDVDAVTLRLMVKTAPRQQYAVARELRARINERLRREGIRRPGQGAFVTATGLDRATPTPPS
ncbi:MAG: mechanosensitive ion channel family protein, partial [Actinobacteria bacterium]|nr:mechanosensitive ion channel family protein [Actinomycetota bacterium]